MSTAKTRLYGVIGWPVEHSWSPAIQSAALSALGVDATYLAFAVHPESLGAAIEGARALGIQGLNVTIPHKERVDLFLDEVDEAAHAIGAVNTIVREGEQLIGTNTDAAGLVRSLEEAGCAVDGARALVLGAGGAARAAVHGLKSAGARVEVAARRPGPARALGRSFGVEAMTLDDVSFESVDLLVQATSATMGADAIAFAEALPLDSLPTHATVVDLVYTPRETTVLRAARARGLATVEGVGMLVWQAALALERWLGRPAPIDVMREAAEGAASMRSGEKSARSGPDP